MCPTAQPTCGLIHRRKTSQYVRLTVHADFRGRSWGVPALCLLSAYARREYIRLPGIAQGRPSPLRGVVHFSLCPFIYLFYLSTYILVQALLYTIFVCVYIYRIIYLSIHLYISLNMHILIPAVVPPYTCRRDTSATCDNSTEFMLIRQLRGSPLGGERRARLATVRVALVLGGEVEVGRRWAQQNLAQADPVLRVRGGQQSLAIVAWSIWGQASVQLHRLYFQQSQRDVTVQEGHPFQQESASGLNSLGHGSYA
jgi:hypothetical protein